MTTSLNVPFDYLAMGLEWGRPERRLASGRGGTQAAHQALATRLTAMAPAFDSAGGCAIGQFFPQLGWAIDEAAVLIQWNHEDGDRDAVIGDLTSNSPVTRATRTGLTPTLRPRPEDRLMPGGVYVHRWITIESSSLAEFLDLSARAWPDFEARFDARIFGLFRAKQSQAERTANVTRLLLMTRYGDHGVWETSRDPTTEAMQILARRQLLIRHTQAASTLLVQG